jgi:hypothetical protein
VLGAALFVSLLILAVLLPLRQPPPRPHVLLLAVTQYDDPACNVAAAAPPLGGFGSERLHERLPDATSTSVRDHLAGLARLPSYRDLVVVLQGAVALNEHGDLAWLPADARPEDPASWLPIAEVLQRLSECPARRQLLILDATPSPAQAATLDVSAALQHALAALPDRRRLTLVGCAPGQQSEHAGVSPGSIFSFYLDEGLRGAADGYADSRRDGQVSVRELAAFVRARVQRWTKHNLDVRQTPMLVGDAADFALTSASAGDQAPAAPRPDATALAQPRAAAPKPAPASPASFPVAASLELRDRAGPDEQRAAAEFAHHLAAAYKQWSTAAPQEREALKLRQLETLAEAGRRVSPAERAWAVYAGLLESKLDPGSVRWADAVLRRLGDAEPRYVETVAIRLLADLANRVEVDKWPTPLVHQVLTLALSSHASVRHPLFHWLRHDLEAAVQSKHEGEIALWATGYVPDGHAERLLLQAQDQLRQANERVAPLLQCRDAQSSAERLLAGFVPYLRHDGRLEGAWGEAVVHAVALRERLAAPPRDVAGREKVAAGIVAESKHLEGQINILREAVHAAVSDVTRRSESPEAGPEVLRHVRALAGLSADWLRSDERAGVAHAEKTLARRLHEATRRLDAEDDRLARVTPPVPAGEPPPQEALRRARLEAPLLRLTGGSEQQVAALRAIWRRLEATPRDSQAWGEWHKALRQAKQPPAPATPHGEAWTWLAQRYRYQAADYEHLGLPTSGILAAQRFYADAAGKHGKLPPAARIILQAAQPIAKLQPGQVHATINLEVKRSLPAGRHGRTDVRVVPPDDAWLEVSPAASELAATFSEEPTNTSFTMPLQLALRESAPRAQTQRPLGFVAQARLDGRAFHRVVTVPLQVASEEVDIQLSSNPKTPQPKLDALHLRPGNVRQSFFLYVRNHAPRARPVTVEVRGGGQLIAGGRVRTTLGAGGLERISFGEAPSALSKQTLPDFDGPLEVRVVDAAKPDHVLAVRSFRVQVLNPRSYVRIADAHVEPAGPNAPGNKFAVRIATRSALRGPSIPAELILPFRRPGQETDEPGAIESELPTIDDQQTVTLSADKIRWSGPPEAECPVYLTVDGVARAFVFRTKLGALGIEPRLDERLAVRIQAAACTLPAANVPVTVEVDNAPPGSRLELSVQRSGAESEAFALTRRFASARDERIGMLLSGPGGALVFEAGIRDWTVPLDTTRWRGRHVLKARLVDAAGQELQHSLQELVVDETPPLHTRFVDAPAQAQKGVSLKLHAEGRDAESDLATVHFFVGASADGKMPSGAAAVAATFEPGRGTWTALVPLPDSPGKTVVSAQFVNRVGLAQCTSTAIELLDVDPASARPAAIVGKVFEGPRPQPNLTVVLRDQDGRDKAKTQTQADGTFRFEGLPPGRYQLWCVKPESGRRVLLPVTVEPGATQRVDLALGL